MKRVLTLLIGMIVMTAGLLAVSPAVSAAPVSRDQAVQLVINRGLAQRGVPYSWGGGDINGPSLGNGPGAAIVGFDRLLRQPDTYRAVEAT